MAVDPYSPCPCGSGQKFKWCCHKVEAFADRAQRLFEGGQLELAIATLDEGLRKEPGNAWLLTRKAVILTKQNRLEEVKATLQIVLAKQPKHLGALMLMTRLVLGTEGPTAGAAQLQQALSAFPPDERRPLGGLMKVVGAVLAESGHFPAARKHLKQSLILVGGELDPAVVSTLRVIANNPTVSPWLKNDDALSPVPDSAPNALKVRFLQATVWAAEGLWSAAAAGFGALTDDPIVGAAAERNLGFCRLWLADDEAAAAALRRFVARAGATTEAVDAEALCQLIAPETPEDQVEHVELVWPLRNRAALLEALEADRTVHSEGTGPLDPDNEQSPEADLFAFLDRPDPRLGETAPLTDGGVQLAAAEIPKIVGRVRVGPETVTLEAHDDGRLDGLSDRLTTLAGASIAPAHPRTKVVGTLPRLAISMAWEWLLPEGIDDTQALRLNREQGTSLVRDVWPNSPMRYLHGRTPLQAAAAGNAEVPLRAAVLLLEQAREPWRQDFDFEALRKRLGINPEPEYDPESVNLSELHLARLAHVPVERLGDEVLLQLLLRARSAGMITTFERAALELVKRPEAMERLEVNPLTIFAELAMLAAGRGEHDVATDWIARGRRADRASDRAHNAPHWDMLELRLRTRGEEAHQWVPDLAVIIERYKGDPEATQAVVMSLVDMGLVEMVQNPDRPGEVLLDSRPLRAVLEEYGPRVTTASGRLGVSATRPEIWTPGSSGGSSGGIWTPGSSAAAPAPAGDKPKIIVTGR